METDKDKNQNREISAGITVLLIMVAVTLVIIPGGLAYWFIAGERSTEWSVISPILLVCSLLWITLACVIALAFLATHFWIISRVKRTNEISQRNAVQNKTKERRLTFARDVGTVLRKRYTFFWRHKVRLLLITGDEVAIEQLVHGLQQQQWLEGNRTVLIYGGSLTTEPDKEKYTTLRKLHRGRHLDGIARGMPPLLCGRQPLVGSNFGTAWKVIGSFSAGS